MIRSPSADQIPPDPVDRILSLPVDASGCYVVTTQTSSHLLDLTHETVTRIPGATASSDGGANAVERLRRDNEPIPVLAIVCTVGLPMGLMLDLRQDGVLTLRITTLVVRIERLHDD